MATLKYTDAEGQEHILNPFKVENVLVTQEKGQSPADVMSQKAVTDELEELNTSLTDHKEDKDKKHIPEGGHERQILIWKGEGEAQWTDMSNSFPGLEDILSYGVEWKADVADPHITRIGNMSLHKTLPIQSQLKGCIAQVDKIIYWLDEKDWRFRKDPKFIEVNLTESTTEIEILNLTDLKLGVGQYLRNGKNIAKITEVNDEESKIIVEWEDQEEEGVSEITSLEIGSRLDGYDGTVRVYCPSFYIKSSVNGDTYRVMISTVKVDDTWTYQPEILLDAYRSTVLRSVPENMGYLSTLPANSAISVVNTAAYCRGGNNGVDYDQYLDTDPFRTKLGKPATAISRANMRLYARNAGNEMLSYNQYKNIFYWLWVIEYANFNSQEAFKEELTEEGYRQGGMGNGLTTMANWGEYNGTYPITPCGYGNILGNGTGVLSIALPEFNIPVAQKNDMAGWSINAALGSVGDGVLNIHTVQSANQNVASSGWDKTSIKTTFNVEGLTETGQTLSFVDGNSVVQSVTEDGEVEIEWSPIMQNRVIRLSEPASELEIKVSVVSAEAGNAVRAGQTLSMPRWRGFDNPFGDIWTNVDGIIINSSSIDRNGVKYSEVYTTDDPAKFSDSNWQDMEKAGEEFNGGNGYIKEFDLGTKAEIIPASNGGNTTQYKCDYHWTNIATGLRTLLMGGRADDGAGAGLGSFSSGGGVATSSANVGFRSVSRFMSFSQDEEKD